MKTAIAKRPKLLRVAALAALLVLGPWWIVGNGAAPEAASGTQEQVHESVIAGSWYPSSPEGLRLEVVGFIGKVPAGDIPGKLAALIAPHAGYAYSGQVAAYAYSVLAKQSFETVVLIGPSHRVNFRGVAVYDRGKFRTPLGLVPLDLDMISALEKQDSRIRYVDGTHTQEHSLEIQLPFLQVLMPGFKLVPLMMGEQNLESCVWLAEAVAKCIKGRSVLVIASSDLSHYHPYDQAKRLDQVVIDKVNALDPEGLSGALARGECEACGGGPMVTAMLIAKRQGANRGRTLFYANSGDVTGDKTAARGGVVGYLAGALWADSSGGASAQTVAPKAGVDLGLNFQEKALLHRIVRENIEARCKGGKSPRIEVTSATLKEPRGAFVTLHKGGQLRGCIGRILSDRPLAETIAEMSVAAAFNDPRFRAVTTDEVKDLDIEISVLTPLRRIGSTDEIQIGVHGIYIRRNGSSGLLLPQVATQYGWDRTTFLEQTCLKARLPRNAWQDEATEIYVFSADVF